MIDKAASIMEEITLSPKEILTQKEDLFFIGKGQLEILYEVEDSRHNITMLDQQTTFNTYQFFTGQSCHQSNYIFKSSSFSTVYRSLKQNLKIIIIKIIIKVKIIIIDFD